jgi:anaerobic ribonucleoside-triphosphate reductase activating protein
VRIISIDYTLKYNSLDIYLAGCSASPHCEGCHNPESWDYNIGETYNKPSLTRIKDKYIVPFDSMIKTFFIMGGEPLDQPFDELICFLSDIKQFNREVWLFTRYELGDIPKEVLVCCDYIKTGRFIPNLDKTVQFGITLASSNQQIFKTSAL